MQLFRLFNSPRFQKSKYRDTLLLVLWIGVGLVLRFINLTGKPPWTDEFATLVFSLGNTFKSVPLDQIITADTLLQPLVVNPHHGVQEAVSSLIHEDHHPPIYFALANLWVQWFSAPGKLVSLGVMRSLPALAGVLAIPAIYCLTRLAFPPVIIAHLAALLLAVSPYGVFISQEARHYTTAVLLVIASLSCLVVAAKNLVNQRSLPWFIALPWIVVNTLGMGVHYFFVLTLGAEIFGLIYLGWRYRGNWLSPRRFISQWWGILIAILGTIAGSLVWLQLWLYSRDDQMTEWIRSGDRSFLDYLNPLFQSAATWVTMIYLLPIEGPNLVVMIVFIIIMVSSLLAWLFPLLYCGIKHGLENPETRLGIEVIGGFVVAAVGIFFAITYGLGMDITRGARYNFVYFPGVIVLVAASLYYFWQQGKLNFQLPQSWTWQNLQVFSQGRNAVVIVVFLGLCSGLTVATNLAYQKYYRPDILIPLIQANSTRSLVLATTHNTLVQTGEMMGIAWDWQRHYQRIAPPQYILTHQQQRECQGDGCAATRVLSQQIEKISQPLDLWLINFHAPVKISNCTAKKVDASWINGYSYKLYRCNQS